jgi:predicted dienelactone hydrolase
MQVPMRSLEILLSLVNLLGFLGLVVPRLHALPWTGYAGPLALLVAIAQGLIEGARWQMVPGYGLAIAVFAIWMFGVMIQGGIHVHRVISVLAGGLGAIVLAISIALPNVLPVFAFPKPTGPYAIGAVTYHWIDTSRPELFTPDPNDHREIAAQIWYPARNEPLAPRAPYIGADTASAIGPLLHLPRFAFSYLRFVRTNAVASAPVAEDRSSYPVLIYLTGIDGFRSVSTFQIQELVSHGYVVVGLDQPGIAPSVRLTDGRQVLGWQRNRIIPLILQSVEPQPKVPTIYGTPLPDGIIPYFAQDASFTLDQLSAINASDPRRILTGRLDLGHVGTFGVSLGGMDVAQTCLMDERFAAGLIMDVYIPRDVVKAGLRQPIMFLTRSADTMRLEHERNGTFAESDIVLTVDTMRRLYANLSDGGYYLEIRGMFHENFTDIPYWSPLMSLIGQTGPINGQRGFDIVNAYSMAFFDRELKGQSSPLLVGPSSRYPEVHFESRWH